MIKRILKSLKYMLLSITALLIALLLIGYIFINFSPQFGATVSKNLKLEYEKSPNHNGQKFFNKQKVQLDMSFSQTFDIVKKFFFDKTPDTKPVINVDVTKVDSLSIADYSGSTRFVWFGHSAFLLQMNGKNILIDPMLGPVPAPHPWLGNNRFSKELPIEIEKLPKIDAVIISHDHYDHLDYNSIMKLKDKVGMFYTPLAVGLHLQEWGIEKERIVELDWWEETSFEDLTFHCTPAVHFSGRGLSDRESTLWSSWVIQSKSENIFFSGDSGYGPHFKEIGEKHGPFDFAMIECGQYNKMWPEIHMFPEETAQAGVDLKAKTIMPIHWGAFKLAMHSWTDPIERVTKQAEKLNLPIISPKIGEYIHLKDAKNDSSLWWLNY